MIRYKVVMIALAIAFVGVAKGQTSEKSQAYEPAMREYQKLMGQFPSPAQTVDHMKQYTEATRRYQEFERQFQISEQQHAEALAKFEQSMKAFEQTSDSFQRAQREYQKFLDSFPTR